MRLTLKHRILTVFSTAILSAVGIGCLQDDVGTCCQVLDEANMSVIPIAPPPDPMDENPVAGSSIRQDPAFDCSGLTCVAYQGSKAFCTRQCEEDADCPEGFTCGNVLDSDPGPNAMLQADDKFCVRTAHDCDTWEP